MKKIDALYDKSFINYRAVLLLCARGAAENFAPWADKLLLFLGAALCVAGVIFFFAFNWFALHKFIKLGICLFLVLACAGVAAVKKFDTNAGQAAGTAAAVFIGAFLAVFGQIYQTGANSYDLFFAWTLLLLPLALCMNKTSCWTLFVILANAAMVLHKFSVAGLFAVNSAFLVITLLPFKQVKQSSYFTYLLNTYITLLTCFSIRQWGWNWVIIPSWAVFLFCFYYFKKPDIYFLGLSFLAASIWLVSQLWIDNFWCMGILILAVSCGAGFALSKINSKIKNGGTK